jgi:3-hydroxy-9,10-secoandrosta-1,3,5(10)-triene-9,17-dione monooxygenase reductase component
MDLAGAGIAGPARPRRNPVTPGCLGLPVIEGGLAHFECTLRKEYIEGDHVIIVGAVESGGVAQEQTPLIYFRGRYHSARPD